MKISKARLRIGIDARFVGPQGTGLGKYTEKLIKNLQELDSQNQYLIFLKKDNWDYLNLREGSNFKKVLADIKWYTLEEQIKLPKIFMAQNLDLLHVPHFNAPIFYRGKFIVTIHDLIHHQFNETSTTTRNPFIFKLKRFGYKKIIDHAIKSSNKILVPSNYVKDDIIENFKIDKQKITVTYEAAEEEYFVKTSNQQPATSNFLLYVGNAYPHKNLNRLLDAFKLLFGNWKLILVCPRDIFAKRLELEVKSRDLQTKVELKGYMQPKELSELFQKATAYVFPTLSEGFGIPSLNAMAAKVPVIASDIPVLREIYGNAAYYFDPTDPKAIASKIKQVITNTKLRDELISKGNEQVKKYSWRKMAQQTLAVYESV